MNESIPTTCSDELDAALFGITEKLTAGFTDDTALLSSDLAGNELTEQIQEVLDDVLVAESWESMAMWFIARPRTHDRDLVPAPVAAPRRAA